MTQEYESFKDFLEMLQNSNYMNIPALIISIIVCLIFFIVRSITIYKKNKTVNWSELFLDLLISIAVSVLVMLICGKNGIIIASTVGIIIALKITSILFKSESKTKEDNDKNHDDINITINNNNGESIEKELVPSYFHPTKVELPEGISLNQLDIISILEMYGYISQNQKFKMVTSSLFENIDEQVHKLLDMTVINKKELKEAYAILNLIKLKNRLVSKEEVLNYIIKMEDQNNNNDTSSSLQNNKYGIEEGDGKI